VVQHLLTQLGVARVGAEPENLGGQRNGDVTEERGGGRGCLRDEADRPDVALISVTRGHPSQCVEASEFDYDPGECGGKESSEFEGRTVGVDGVVSTVRFDRDEEIAHLAQQRQWDRAGDVLDEGGVAPVVAHPCPVGNPVRA
jgi:hypothetical protein